MDRIPILRHITVKFEVDENLTAEELHELLCRAIHEGFAPLADKARSITDIEIIEE